MKTVIETIIKTYIQQLAVISLIGMQQTPGDIFKIFLAFTCSLYIITSMTITIIIISITTITSS